jgi:hypothetical protein
LEFDEDDEAVPLALELLKNFILKEKNEMKTIRAGYRTTSHFSENDRCMAIKLLFFGFLLLLVLSCKTFHLSSTPSIGLTYEVRSYPAYFF